MGWLSMAVFGWGFYLVTGQVPFVGSSSDFDSGFAAMCTALHPEPTKPQPPPPGSRIPDQQMAYSRLIDQ